MVKSEKNKKNTSVRNRRGDKEPQWFFGVGGTILSILFLPVFIIASYIYLAQWMCYNFNLPMAVCYVLTIVAFPLFLPLFLISFLVKAVTG